MNDYHDYEDDGQHEPEAPEPYSPDQATPREAKLSEPELRAIEAMARLAELGHAELIPDLLVALTGAARYQTPASDQGYRVSHHSTPLLDAAKAKAQGLILTARINRQNDHLKNKYADINAVLEASMKACSDSGLAVTQTPWTDRNGHLILTTRLACEGQWIEGDLLVRVELQKGVNAKQAGGIAMTYIRRYALNAMLNIPAGDDNDGDDGIEESTDHSAPAQNKWGVAVRAFGALGVKPPVMLAFLDRKTVNEVDDDDHASLQTWHGGLKSGDPAAKAKLDELKKRLGQ